MENSSRYFQPLLNQFRFDKPYIALENIKHLVEEAEKQTFLHNLFLIILLPRALILNWRIKSIIKSQKDLNNFSVLIQKDQLLIILSTLSYVAMWWHFFPIIWHSWYLLFSWENFIFSVMQWSTLQGLIILLFHYPISQWALQSFKLTATFEDRYQALKSLDQARYQVISSAPEMMQNLINQSFTVMISSEALDEETARTVAKIMQSTYREILGSFNDDVESEVDDDEFLSREFLSLEKEEKDK